MLYCMNWMFYCTGMEAPTGFDMPTTLWFLLLFLTKGCWEITWVWLNEEGFTKVAGFS